MKQLIMEAFMDRHPGWSIVEGNAACMMYLYRNWSFSRRVEENVAQLSALANVSLRITTIVMISF